jgi:hypothetical protein
MAAAKTWRKAAYRKRYLSAAISIFGGSDGMALKPLYVIIVGIEGEGRPETAKKLNQSGGIEASANVAKCESISGIRKRKMQIYSVTRWRSFSAILLACAHLSAAGACVAPGSLV